ncbi:MAG: hypothetical protein HOO95_06680 [Gallionella sp.]|nr:hypothetical protein [Gallionella sp.]
MIGNVSFGFILPSLLLANSIFTKSTPSKFKPYYCNPFNTKAISLNKASGDAAEIKAISEGNAVKGARIEYKEKVLEAKILPNVKALTELKAFAKQ